MRKADLIKEVTERFNIEHGNYGCKVVLTSSEADIAVCAVINGIIQALSRGEQVELRGFGTFKVVKTKPKKGHDFRSGKTVAIKPRNVVRFKPSKLLNKIVK